MSFQIVKYTKNNLNEICDVWNEAIDEGLTLPWKEFFSVEKTEYIINTQIECFCAITNNSCVGFYILHPNGSGRNDHVANALYIVKKQFRRQGIGTALVKHSLQKAKEHGFIAMQYNSVVASNSSFNIYLKLGFEKVGAIPDGFKLDDNKFYDLFILHKGL